MIFNTVFGKLTILSPYLWLRGISSKPLVDVMKIYHNGRSETVERALADFGIEESFANAAIRFKEHYHYDIGPSAVARSTRNTVHQAMDFIDNKFSNADAAPENTDLENNMVKMSAIKSLTTK